MALGNRTITLGNLKSATPDPELDFTLSNIKHNHQCIVRTKNFITPLSLALPQHRHTESELRKNRFLKDKHILEKHM
jgi:hypothetical protein